MSFVLLAGRWRFAFSATRLLQAACKALIQTLPAATLLPVAPLCLRVVQAGRVIGSISVQHLTFAQ